MASSLCRKFPKFIFRASEYRKFRLELALVTGKTVKSEIIVNSNKIHEITKEIIVTFEKSKGFFKSGLKKKKKTIILKANKFVSPFTKTPW